LVPPDFLIYDETRFQEIARMYRAVTRQIEVTVEPNFMAGTLVDRKTSIFLVYTIVITNTGGGDGATADRHWIITTHRAEAGSPRAKRVGEQPCSPRRALRIHQRGAAPDRLGLHDRAFSNGERRGAVRVDVPDILARRPDNKRV